MANSVYIAVDVGTGSARAGVFDVDGTILAHGSQAITLWQEKYDYREQSSDEIWRAVCAAVRMAMSACTLEVKPVGIGFTGTCSLVVLGADGRPVTVSPSGDHARNVILWMDHRAREEAAQVNSSGSDVLSYVGGRISEEMQIPKLLWLKEHMPESWQAAGHFFDLPDFLTWRASGSPVRSMCSLVCKWTYLGHENRWDQAFIEQIGLGDLLREQPSRIGDRVARLGDTVGCLSREAAFELGLPEGIPVAVSAIDAHAGGVGLLGAHKSGEYDTVIDFKRRMALICGTSNCHMAVSSESNFVPGVWGPYYSAMVPGYWLNEGGQSAAGALIDHVLGMAGADLEREASEIGMSVYEFLNNLLTTMAADADVPLSELTADLHVYPDFHGNRSPIADASLKGMVSGLPLSHELSDVARLYLATIQAIAYGTRHIIEAFNKNGYRIDTLFACGGGTKNPRLLQEFADAISMPIVLGETEEAVLLGAAMLAAVAARSYDTLPEAMAGMSRIQRVVLPSGGRVQSFHDRKYRVFRRQHADQCAYRAIMLGE